MFGLHTFLPSIVRRQRFRKYGHEEMRDDSPQHACLNKYNTVFYLRKSQTYVSKIQCYIYL